MLTFGIDEEEDGLPAETSDKLELDCSLSLLFNLEPDRLFPLLANLDDAVKQL